MTATLDGARRKGRPRDVEVDRRITEAALEVLAEAGASAFSVAEVAERSGVAKTSIYRRFPTRDALLLGALERLNDDLPAVPEGGSARDRLVVLLGGIRRRSPGSLHGRLMLQVAATQDPRLAQLVYERVILPRQRVLCDVVREGMASGEFRADLDLDSVVPALVGPMLYLRIWHAVPALSALSVDAVVDHLIQGMTSPAG